MTQAARPEGAEEMPQATRLDDVRIRDVRPLISPALLQYEQPADDAVQAFVEHSRAEVADVVHGREVRNREALANPDALEQFSNRIELS